ncbi:MAG: hypothetical protein LAT64_09090 [Phycisphaerales bacterium]|nr:hypothetical protein [Planctomycetota bacterium]MCH8508904.1 hypothetical protein [Phycisphaerales bacterium]
MDRKISNRTMTATLATALIAGAAATALGDVDHHTLQSDNGVRELGYTVSWSEAMIGNYYHTPNGEELTITSVEVALGYGQEGRPFELLIYNDPDNDNNPTNAVLVSSAAGTIIPDAPSINTLKLQTVEIDPVVVDGGFFVAVRLADQPWNDPNLSMGDWETAPSARRLDYQAPTNNWRVTGLPASGPMGGITPIDTNDLSNNFVSPVQLNWVIRVSGTTPVEPTVLSPDMNGDGVHDWWDVYLFMNMFVDGNADFNNDGVTNYFDIIDFLAAWHQPPE